MLLISSVFAAISLNLASATGEVSTTAPKCLSIPTGMEKTPTAISNEIMASTYKLTNAMTNFHSVKPSLKYWDEIRCLASILTGGNETAVRQIQTFRLQQIIRDTVISRPRYIELPQNLPRFIAAVGLRDGYDFLLTEMRDIESLFYGKATVFDIALVMQNDSRLEKATFEKALPAAVRGILGSSEKPVFLKDEITGSYLNFNASCEAGETNCSSFVLSKERGDGWKFVPTAMSMPSESLGSATGFKMFTAAKTNDREALLRTQNKYDGHLAKNGFLFSLEDDHKITIHASSYHYEGGPCFGVDGNGTFVAHFVYNFEDRFSRVGFHMPTKRQRNCTKWTVIVE